MCFTVCFVCFFFFKQKTAYERRISDWSSDVCSSDLAGVMRASAAELDAAATNVLVLATFWLNYAAVRGDKDENAAIRDGIVQVMMLLAPFLRDAERVHLNNLTQAYID